jgi:hypothetical protein
MANFKRIPVLVDAATGKQIDEFGAVVRDNDFFRLLFDETVILCCQFYNVSWIDGEAQLNEHPVDPDLTLSAFGDNDFDPLTSFMFLSEQTEDADNKVNIANDWLDGLTADPANGQLSFRVSTNTVRFNEALQNSTGIQKFYFCISGIPSGQTEKTVLAYFRFKAENRPSSSAGIPAPADPEYLNTQEVQALVKSAPVFEFSIDGATLWHSVQVNADRYYREQRNNGEWSDAIKMIPGATGDKGNTGDTGATGTTGTPGSDGIDGTGYNDQGDYSSETTYAANDTVTYNGSLFFSLADNNTDNVPNSSPAHWRLLVSKGADGTDGADGADGTNGTNGADGTDGNTWFFSTGVPAPGLGVDGDSALDTLNMKVYLKVTDAWVLQGIIKGDQGADGTGIAPRGEWDSSTDYVLNNAVSNDGSLWRAAQASTNQAPPSLPTTSNDYWDILVAKGDAGTDGADGTNGTDGAPGDDAASMSIEYSINGATAWHAVYTSEDLYIRFSTDGEVTWSAGIQFLTNGMPEPPADDDHYARVAGSWVSLEESSLLSGGGITKAQAIEIALIYG